MKSNTILIDYIQSFKDLFLSGLLISKRLFTLSLIAFNTLYSISQSNANNSSNILQYGEKEFSMSQGMEEVYKTKENHSASGINLTDGEFYQTQIWISGTINLIWRARNASVWLYLDCYAPGDSGLTSGTYEFMPKNTDPNNQALAGTYFYKKGKLAIDLNQNGKLDKGSEFIKITDGIIKISVSGDTYDLEYNLILENSVKVLGNFTGNLDQV